ncbi:hypothetical protein EN852_009730 [Mesorhizobium sp. M2E.F.Ca.ET.209.01.1.1]|uniref:hypothetical protein n=1 Tax=Mesorhizobium sp. M2E.F.Ca.ET.209.01.1.1 TaxID=2500526 RepID=UPI000FD76D17|nr:hypothetical protein [Mesorhizobium sp. M2E.F.Ca.ET.209.01.1.1]TGS15903.1 hypothetical protein EN852_009730 [Mesorhizobium sp. M2E.F.Ca.ET.209.01.1.1]
MKPAPTFEQVDVCLAEDQRTVVLYAYDCHDNCFMQSFDPLPMPIEEDSLVHQEWRLAARPRAWRPLA